MIVFVHNLVTKDFWLKLFSLALAILIWLTVKFSISGEAPTSPWLALIGRSPDEMVVTVPVRVPVVNGRTFSVDPTNVVVTLHGDPKLLKGREQDIRALVDPTGIEAADGLMRPVELVLPPGIAYTHLDPKEVSVGVSPKKTE